MDGNRSTASDSQFISFQDFPSIDHEGDIGQAQLNINASTHQGFNNLQNDPTGIGIMEDLQGMPAKNEAPSYNFWSLEFYQKFFNVNTDDVVDRIKRSMVPYGTENYLITHIRPNPDLYGPYWICMTLIFSITIGGNIANYLQTVNHNKYLWTYDFHIIIYVTTYVALYVMLVPSILWSTLIWTSPARDTDEELITTYTPPNLFELVCLYGYSLAIYIPISFLWTIQISWLQWSLIIIATISSGGVLLRSLLPVIKGRYKIIYIMAIVGLHLLLGAGFMHYFYHLTPKFVDLAQHVATTAGAIEPINHGLNNGLTIAPVSLKSH